MINFALFGSDPVYPWGRLIDIIIAHRPVYPRYGAYSGDVAALKEILEDLGFNVAMVYNDSASLELHFKDPHQELLFKLKYL